MYAKIENGLVVEYPYALRKLKTEHPNVTFPANPTPATLEGFGVVFVIATDVPEHNNTTHKCVEGTPAFNAVKDRWEQTYQIDPFTTEELEAMAAKASNDLLKAKLAALQRIDDEVDSIYAKTMGNRAEEYRLAESEANAYINGNYEGTVPGTVASWAAAKSWTPAEAADDIAMTAMAWREAQGAIRQHRLAKKEQIRVSTNATEIETVLFAWRTFLNYIKVQLAIV